MGKLLLVLVAVGLGFWLIRRGGCCGMGGKKESAMPKRWISCVGLWFVLILGATPFLMADEEHHAGHGEMEAVSSGSVALTGEVVDVFCYMSHGKDGLGPKHAACAKKCISGGLPVAIRSGDQLYLASMSDHTAANQALAEFSGKDVTVHGEVTEQDGMKFISVDHVEK